MVFHSILFKDKEDSPKEEQINPEEPILFTDLNLNQVIDTINTGKEDYHLKTYFYTPLTSVEAILYRYDIMRDMETPELFEHIKQFAQQMLEMREQSIYANKLSHQCRKERVFLDTVVFYCEVIHSLKENLSFIELKSHGLSSFRDYLTSYTQSDDFSSLVKQTNDLISNLSVIKYSTLIDEGTVTVGYDDVEANYSTEVEKIFEKFSQDAEKDYRINHNSRREMNYVEEQILDRVVLLYPEIFQKLSTYCDRHRNFLDEQIVIFEREIQFYVAYLDYIAPLKQIGLPFCYPHISRKKKELYTKEGFDLALAHKLIEEKSTIVCNDFYLKGKERVIVVSGPNQGGKTTFARMLGQLHYLASIGCPVPSRESQLLLFDHLFTQFEKEEDSKTLHGKLEDDLLRIHHILEQSTTNSILILNEIFNSTTLQDAVFLSQKIMEKILGINLLCIWVTFVDELASFDEKIVSMVSTVVPENPSLRTFKIIRQPADGLAYAITIAEKYRLTYGLLKAQLKA